MSGPMTLGQRVDELIGCHGTLREVSRLLQIDCGYLSRLRNGEKMNPSRNILQKLGLREVVYYERIKPKLEQGS